MESNPVRMCSHCMPSFDNIIITRIQVDEFILIFCKDVVWPLSCVFKVNGNAPQAIALCILHSKYLEKKDRKGCQCLIGS